MGTGREEHSTGGWRCLPEFGRSWLPLAAIALCLAYAASRSNTALPVTVAIEDGYTKPAYLDY